MKISPEDPKLTAYLLNELEESEMAEIREAIDNDPELQKEIKALSQLTDQLKQEFTEDELIFDDLSKEKILSEIETKEESEKKILQLPWQVKSWPIGLAASLAFVCYMMFQVNEFDLSHDLKPQEEATKEVEFEVPVPITSELLTEEIVDDVVYKKPVIKPKKIQYSVEMSDSSVDKLQKIKPITEERLNVPEINISMPELKKEQTSSGVGAGLGRGDSFSAMPAGNAPEEITRVNAGQERFALGFAADQSVVEVEEAKDARLIKRKQSPLGHYAVGFGAFAPMQSQISLSVADSDTTMESYDSITENKFFDAINDPLSTFSIDVDTASYSNIRRYINNGSIPPKGAVRIEELINYFPYAYRAPNAQSEIPFSIHSDLAKSPWDKNKALARIAIQGKEIDWSEKKASNLVFLIDVSGSMGSPDKLPLVQKSLAMMLDQFDVNDRIAIVVYAGSSGLVLPSTTANNAKTIKHALDNLRAGGSTNGAEGIELAYNVAEENWVEGGNNRVILCTDGDFNVGISNRSDLVDLIQKKAANNIFLSIFGFGTGNLQDATMEELTNKGNGNYGYIDSLNEAKKLLVEQAGGTLYTIAKDVKIQVEFNPAKVKEYRLVGYENRKLDNQDFANDKVDAGEIGAGHRVTALYEIIHHRKGDEATEGQNLKYQQSSLIQSDDWFTVKVRYKEPEEDTSKLIEEVVNSELKNWSDMDADYQFASMVAAWGMLLRDSEFVKELTLSDIYQKTKGILAKNPDDYRNEFLKLVQKSKELN